MIDWPVKQVICGLDELAAHGQSGVTHLLSLLNPGAPEPGCFNAMPPRKRLTLHFHDVILDHPDYVRPQRADVERILAFGDHLPDGDPAHLLVHCHMGLSRSTAALASILLQVRPDLDDDLVLAHIAELRPKAWPNSLVVRHADALLGRGGRMIAALGRFYRRQLEAHPGFADPLRSGGRLAEIEMAEAAGG